MLSCRVSDVSGRGGKAAPCGSKKDIHHPCGDPDTGGRRDSAASGIKEGRIFRGRVWDYLEAGLKRTKDEIVEIIRKYPTEEEQLKIMLATYHKGVKQEEQPDFAFLLNAAATLKVIRRECMNDADPER